MKQFSYIYSMSASFILMRNLFYQKQKIFLFLQLNTFIIEFNKKNGINQIDLTNNDQYWSIKFDRHESKPIKINMQSNITFTLGTFLFQEHIH